MKNENMKHVQNIVVDLENYASGDYFLHNGELFPIDENEFSKVDGCTIRKERVFDEVHYFYIMPDGEKIPEDEIEIATIGDYFDEFYDIDYVVGKDKKYKACRVLVAFGGPNIYIDTWDRQVQLFWWSNTATADIPIELCEQIDEFFKMLYEC